MRTYIFEPLQYGKVVSEPPAELQSPVLVVGQDFEAIRDEVEHEIYEVDGVKEGNPPVIFTIIVE